jgi:hypothetical protein
VSAKKLVAALVAFAGATAFTACLLALVDGMRDVAQTDGGFCASGGPYVIAHQCSSSDIRLIMIGIFGALIAAGFYAGGSAGLGSKAASAGLVLWAALFGTLGWNFVSIGHSGASGMLFTGVLFLAMAVGGLIPLLFRLADDLRSPSSQPSPVIPGMQPLVRAAVPSVPGMQPGPGTTFQAGAASTFQPGATSTFQPGMLPLPGLLPGTSAVSQAAARSTELLRTGVWLVVSVAGTAFGIALSASLISMLR